MSILPASDYVLMKPGDYEWAVLHFAWYRDDQDRYLIFAFAELVPTELPKPIPTKEVSQRVPVYGERSYIYFKREVVPVAQAVDWYEKCRNGIVELVNNPRPVNLIVTGFRQEPEWPVLVTTNELPFTPYAARAHRLLQPNLPNVVRRLRDDIENLAWLSELMHFDLFRYEEAIGSVSLVADNPVFRRLEHTRGNAVPGAHETSDLYVVARAGQTLDGITVYFDSHRAEGLSDVRAVHLSGSYIRLPHQIESYKTSLVAVSATYGVLAVQGAAGFLRSIHLNLSVPSRRRVVQVPSALDDETHEVTEWEKTAPMIFGDAEADVGGNDLIWASMESRKQEALADELGQRVFFEDGEGAKKYVQQLIGKASKSVDVIDPYLATTALFRFALARSGEAVNVRIVTSGQALTQGGVVDEAISRGHEIQKQITGRPEFKNISVHVLGKNSGPIHDRFLVIDGQVWLSGNSFEMIGVRLSSLIRFPFSTPIRKQLEEIIDERGQDLSAWIENLDRVRARPIHWKMRVCRFLAARLKRWCDGKGRTND